LKWTSPRPRSQPISKSGSLWARSLGDVLPRRLSLPGGRLLVSLPDHLDALDEGDANVKILHHDETQKLTRWQVTQDGLSAMLDVESPFTPRS
jgi:hypothetical protein